MSEFVPHTKPAITEFVLPNICRVGQFQCPSGKCIPSEYVCDKYIDWPGGEDEINCTCGHGEVPCLSIEKCIPNEWVCDNYDDCPNGSDELPEICSMLPPASHGPPTGLTTTAGTTIAGTSFMIFFFSRVQN
jgi:hypothetical protein